MFRQLIDWLTGAPSAAGNETRAESLGTRRSSCIYWDGSVPAGHQLRDVSLAGAYLYTSERWYPGTIIRLLLQRTRTGDYDSAKPGERGRHRLPFRPESSGTARTAWRSNFSFVIREDRQLLAQLIAGLPASLRAVPYSRVPKNQATSRTGNDRVCLMLPLLFLLIVNAVNFGGFLFAWITIANAARAGAQYWVLGSARDRDTHTRHRRSGDNAGDQRHHFIAGPLEPGRARVQEQQRSRDVHWARDPSPLPPTRSRRHIS